MKGVWNTVKAIAAAGLMLAGTADISLAQAADADESASGDFFQVELLVFRHLDQARTTREIPRPVEPTIDDVLEQQLARLSLGRQPTPTIGTGPAVGPVLAWYPVSEDRRGLNADADRLRRLDAYDILAQLAWVQPAPDLALSEALPMTMLGTGGSITGEVRLYRKRYLHLSVDVALTDAFTRSAIVDSRRMRIGRTAYFDQPEFGILALISRAEPPVAAEARPLRNLAPLD
jgi:hypothetical protein